MRSKASVTTLMAIAFLALVPAAQAQQFGIEDFTGMVFANDARDANGDWVVNDHDAYTNSGTPGASA